ncbi:MAG: heavy metal-binding domain-containing protein [Pseudomonadota bacterium]
MQLLTLDHLPQADIIIGDLLTVSAVSAANCVRDFHENLRNLVGGHLTHYERLMDQAVERALDKLRDKAAAAGYDGVLGVTFSHPKVTDGAVELLVYGNGFRYSRKSSGDLA